VFGDMVYPRLYSSLPLYNSSTRSQVSSDMLPLLMAGLWLMAFGLWRSFQSQSFQPSLLDLVPFAIQPCVGSFPRSILRWRLGRVCVGVSSRCGDRLKAQGKTRNKEASGELNLFARVCGGWMLLM
jgi:hypothetical protein